MNHRAFSRTITKKNTRRRIKSRGGQGEIPTAENPVIENGDEIRIHIENLYRPLRQANPVYDANPVHIVNYRDFNIDEDGNFYIKYTDERFKYGHVDKEGVFVSEPGIIMQHAFTPMRVRGNGLTPSSLNYGIDSIEVVPTNIIKTKGTNEGTVKTPGFPPSEYAGKKITPIYYDKRGPHTMKQIKDFIKYSVSGLDLDIRTSSALKRILNLGLYGIYHNNTKKLYLKYEFIKAVFTDPKKKTQGYLVFRKGEPLRKRELEELSPLVKDLDIRPYDNPASAFGKSYRSAKSRFEKEHGQTFEEGEKYKEVVKELSRKTRKSRSKSRDI